MKDFVKAVKNGTRVPQQRRSAATLERILTATVRLLETKSFDELSVAEITREARAPVGSFYARFDMKESLLSELYKRYRENLDRGDEMLSRNMASTLREQIAILVSVQIRRFRDHRGLLRTIALREREQRMPLHHDLERWGRAATKRRIAALRPFVAEIEHADPERAIKMGLYFVMAIIREKILFGDSPHARITPMSDRRLGRELIALLTNYLRGQSACASTPEMIHV